MKKRTLSLIMSTVLFLGFAVVSCIFINETYNLAGDLAFVTFVLGGFFFKTLESLLYSFFKIKK